MLARAVTWPHLPGIAAQFGVGVWLCRAYASSAIPAGTDMLGFVSRAAVNSRGSTWMAAWDPDSLGAPRQLTLESLLGLLTKPTGDPVLTVKLFVLATLVASGIGAYWLTWRWYRTRLGATVAGLLYTTCQISLAQTASGHLNVCVVLALAPLIIGLTVEGVEAFSARRACLLGAALALLILARPDMPLYLVPFAILYVPIHGLVTSRLRASLRNGLLTASVALGTAFALSLYDVIPLVGGVRAEWASSGGLFGLQEFNSRSVPALGSLLGFAREIGYLAFTNRQTWFSHPWISFGAYAALAAIPVLAAWGVLALRRDPRTIYLIACAILGSFAAKGMHQPLGAPYQWAALHVPFFSNMRDPDRWLIGGSLAVAVLAGVMASKLPSLLRWLEASRPARALVAGAIASVVLLPNAPTVLSGLATWRPAAGQTLLLRAASVGSSPLATVPFDQTRRYVVDGSYQGWEHDLGSESPLWTGRPALADGGWSAPASGTIGYLTTLLGRRDPSFPLLLGALGVNQVAAFNYSPTAPGLVNYSDPDYQQQAVASMPALQATSDTGGGTLFNVQDPSAELSARSLRAVVLGGLSGLRALVRMHGLAPSQWAAEDADGLLSSGGEAALLAAIRQANLVMVADTSVSDVALVATKPIIELAGISSDSDLARATQTLPPDVAMRTGAFIDPDAAAPTVGVHSSSVSFTLAHAVSRAELWAHVQSLADAATLSFAVDGHDVGELTPVAPASGGFSWIRVNSQALTPGHHTLSVRAIQSAYGGGYELDAVRLVSAQSRARSYAALNAALAQAAPRTAYAADLGNGLDTVRDPRFFTPGQTIGGGPGYWKTLEPSRTAVSAVGSAIAVRFADGRHYHALIAHYFATARDWSRHAYAYLRVRGDGSGVSYSVLLDGDVRDRYTIQLPWTDNGRGWRLLAIPLLGDPTVARHVLSIRVASDHTDVAGRLQIGGISLSASADSVVEHLPIPAAAARRAELVDERHPTRDHRALVPAVSAGRGPGAGTSVRISLATLGQHNLLLVPPRDGLPAAPATTLSWRRTGNDQFAFDVRSSHPSTLVLGLSQDPHWRLSGVRGAVPTRVWGALQAWRIPPGNYRGTISFAGDRLVRTGLEVSGVVALLLIGLGLGLHRRLGGSGVRRRLGTLELRGRAVWSAASARLPRLPRASWYPALPARGRAARLAGRVGPAWWLPMAVAFCCVVAVPFVVTGGPGPAGDALAVVAMVAMAVAVVLAALETRRSSCRGRDS